MITSDSQVSKKKQSNNISKLINGLLRVCCGALRLE